MGVLGALKALGRLAIYDPTDGDEERSELAHGGITLFLTELRDGYRLSVIPVLGVLAEASGALADTPIVSTAVSGNADAHVTVATDDAGARESVVASLQPESTTRSDVSGILAHRNGGVFISGTDGTPLFVANIPTSARAPATLEHAPPLQTYEISTTIPPGRGDGGNFNAGDHANQPSPEDDIRNWWRKEAQRIWDRMPQDERNQWKHDFPQDPVGELGKCLREWDKGRTRIPKPGEPDTVDPGSRLPKPHTVPHTDPGLSAMVESPLFWALVAVVGAVAAMKLWSMIQDNGMKPT